ncbi:MAG: TldD/PmbA family protein [Candidatus Micrarchaeia archaeon]
MGDFIDTNAKDIVKYAINRGFEEAVVNTFIYNAIYMKITNSKIDSVIYKNHNSGNILITNKKKIFRMDFPSLEEKEIKSSLEKADKHIALIKPKEDYNGIAEGPFKYNKNNTHYDKKIENFDIKDIAEIANSIINNALAEGVKEVAGMVIAKFQQYSLATSKNVDVNDKSTSLRISIRTFGENLSYQNTVASALLSKIKPEKISKDTAKLIVDVNKYGKIKNGSYDILYLPAPAANLLDIVNSAACINSIETGSFFVNKLNKEVANKDLTIYDDGNYEGAIYSSAFDDEGYPTQRNEIIKNGILNKYLHNYSTAIKYNTKSTGNAGLVEPEPKTLILEHKNIKDFDNIVKNMDKGIIITNVWYTRFSNMLAGDFSTMPRDLAIYVENGEKKFAIKQKNIGEIVGIRIHDNIIRMLKNIEIVGNDTIQATSWDSNNYAFVPSILVKDVKVSTI